MLLKGNDLMLFANDGKKYTSIAYATNHTLELSADTKDVSNKDMGNGCWSSSEIGMYSWSTSSENMVSDGAENGHNYNTLFDMFLKREKVKIAFSLQTDNIDYAAKLDSEYSAPAEGWTYDAANHYEGDAIITSLSLTAQNGEYATYTVQFQGCGALKKIGNGIKKK